MFKSELVNLLKETIFNLQISLDVTKITKIQAIFPKHPYIRTCPYKKGRLRHTGSVANSSNGLKLIKKRAKNGHFETKTTGEKRAKRVLIRKRNGRLMFYYIFFYESVNNELEL